MKVTPDREGYDWIVDNVPFQQNNDSLHGTSYPSCHVHATIEHDRGTTTGVVLHIGSSSKHGADPGDDDYYNGFFLKVRQDNGTGHSNVYADPNTDGPTILHTEDWDGKGARRYKYHIQSIELEIRDHDPKCRCGETMLYGHSNEDDNRVRAGDGSYGRWYAGWMCPDCFPGRIREDEQLP